MLGARGSVVAEEAPTENKTSGISAAYFVREGDSNPAETTPIDQESRALQSSRWVTGSACPETDGVVGGVRERRGKVLPRVPREFSDEGSLRFRRDHQGLAVPHDGPLRARVARPEEREGGHRLLAESSEGYVVYRAHQVAGLKSRTRS